MQWKLAHHMWWWKWTLLIASLRFFSLNHFFWQHFAVDFESNLQLLWIKWIRDLTFARVELKLGDVRWILTGISITLKLHNLSRSILKLTWMMVKWSSRWQSRHPPIITPTDNDFLRMWQYASQSLKFNDIPNASSASCRNLLSDKRRSRNNKTKAAQFSH